MRASGVLRRYFPLASRLGTMTAGARSGASWARQAPPCSSLVGGREELCFLAFAFAHIKKTDTVSDTSDRLDTSLASVDLAGAIVAGRRRRRSANRRRGAAAGRPGGGGERLGWLPADALSQGHTLPRHPSCSQASTPLAPGRPHPKALRALQVSSPSLVYASCAIRTHRRRWPVIQYLGRHLDPAAALPCSLSHHHSSELLLC